MVDSSSTKSGWDWGKPGALLNPTPTFARLLRGSHTYETAEVIDDAGPATDKHWQYIDSPTPTSAFSVYARELEDLREQVAKLEDELETLEDALFAQEFHIIDEYIVTVWPVGDGSYIASCPKLHASVQECSQEKALRSVREAMAVVEEAFQTKGRPMPPWDVCVSG